MKKELQFLHSLNDIDDSFVDEAIEFKRHKFPFLTQPKLVPVLSFSMCLLLLFVFISYKPSQQGGELTVGGNPYSETYSSSEVEDKLGYTLTAPVIENTTVEYYILDTMVEVQYYENDEQKYFIRKDVGTDDISGIYTTFDYSETITSNDLAITIKGNSDTYYLATWISGKYTYAFYAVNGLDKETLLSYVSKIN